MTIKGNPLYSHKLLRGACFCFKSRNIVMDRTQKATLLVTLVVFARTEHVKVSDISCHTRDFQFLSATLKKPTGFRGYPSFADNRRINSKKDEACQIRPDDLDVMGTRYYLRVSDFTRCPVENENGYVSVRVWFPQMEGIIMKSDQEVDVRCRVDQKPTVTGTKVTAFTATESSSGDKAPSVLGEVSEDLHYTLALFKESTDKSGVFDYPVDGAVTIGTMLQLKAIINSESGWKYAKLLEVTVSASPQNRLSPGYIPLVRSGCRVKEYEGLMPSQPMRADDNPGQVTLDFQAFLLERTDPSDELWVHAKLQACGAAEHCRPDLCLDLFHPTGYGRRRRFATNGTLYPREQMSLENWTIRPRPQAVAVEENVAVRVRRLTEADTQRPHPQKRVSCTSYVASSGILTCLLVMSVGLAASLGCRLRRAVKLARDVAVESVYASRMAPPFVRDRHFRKAFSSSAGARCMTLPGAKT